MTLLGGRRERNVTNWEGLSSRSIANHRREDVKDGRATDFFFALSGRVLAMSVSQSWFRGWPVEVLPPKQVKRYRPRRLGLQWSPVRDSLDFQLNHDRANGVLAYRVSRPETEASAEPRDPVGAARLLVDLGDLLRRSGPA